MKEWNDDDEKATSLFHQTNKVYDIDVLHTGDVLKTFNARMAFWPKKDDASRNENGLP